MARRSGPSARTTGSRVGSRGPPRAPRGGGRGGAGAARVRVCARVPLVLRRGVWEAQLGLPGLAGELGGDPEGAEERAGEIRHLRRGEAGRGEARRGGAGG